MDGWRGGGERKRGNERRDRMVSVWKEESERRE